MTTHFNYNVDFVVTRYYQDFQKCPHPHTDWVMFCSSMQLEKDELKRRIDDEVQRVWGHTNYTYKITKIIEVKVTEEEMEISIE